MHLVVKLPTATRDRAVAVRAAEAGLWVMPLSGCYLGAPRPGFVLGFSATAPGQMREAVRRLGRLMR